ncbi:MAG: Gldg family protein [Candidatus Merdivicinus sp.]|jgi:ABC-2 type transport system permease protein
MKLKFSVNKRRLKYGSLATAMAIGFVAVVVLVNIIVGMLVERFPMDIDLTEDNIFELTQPSIDYIKDLDAEVVVNVLWEEESFKNQNDYYRQAYEVIEKYEKYSDHITVRYIDLLSNPELQQKYPKETLSTGQIIVECGDRYQLLTAYDLFNTQYDQQSGSTYITSSAAEQAMTSAIMNVTDANPPTVAVLTGFGTTDVSSLTDILSSNGYVVEEVDLMTGDISDYTMAILAAPTVDLSTNELDKLDAFLDNDGQFGKNLMYFASVNQPELPLLEEFLSEWGIVVGDGYLYETDTSKIYFNPSYTLQEYGDETYTENLATTELPVLVPMSRPLSSAFGESGTSSNRSTTVLLKTYDSVVVVPSDAMGSSDSNWDPNTDGVKDSYITAMAGSRVKYDQTTALTSTVLAFGSVDMVHESFLSFAAINNGDFVLNAANYVCDKEEGISIVPKTVGTSSLGINQSQVNTIGALAQFVLPIIVLIIGATVWMRRRNK